VSSPGGKDLWPSTRFTQETEGKKILGLAYGGERLEQFLYRNVLIAVTVYITTGAKQQLFIYCIIPADKNFVIVI
jgi:hypothetical protein